MQHTQLDSPVAQESLVSFPLYLIDIKVTVPLSARELADLLQEAYDEGAAGRFNIRPAGISDLAITFGRYMDEDLEFVAPRIAAGRTDAQAAAEQLADEFEELQNGPDCLTAVIMALRHSAKVTGVTDLEVFEKALDDRDK